MNLLYTYPSRKIFRLLPGVAMKPVPKPSPEIVEGHQSRNEIGRLCRKYGFTNVMIITDKVLYSLDGSRNGSWVVDTSKIKKK